MERINEKDLDAVIGRINEITGNAKEPYSKQDDGTVKANVGNYHLDCSYGGYALSQMVNESGGIRRVIHSGFTTKRNLYNLMQSYLSGLTER